MGYILFYLYRILTFLHAEERVLCESYLKDTGWTYKIQLSTPSCAVMKHEEVTCVRAPPFIAFITAFGSSLADLIFKIFDIGKYIFSKPCILITIILIRFHRAIIIYIKLTY